MNTYKVIWKLENIPAVLAEVIKKEYVRVYNMWANDSEGWFKLWNKEYDETHPKLESYFDSPDYNSWIGRKMEQKIAESYKSRFMTFTVDEDTMPVGHVVGLKGSSITFYMKLVQEECG